MADITYVFGDALSGERIAELSMSGVSMSDKLSGGEFRGSVYLDRSGQNNDAVISATIPGRCYCVIERDGVVIGDYIIWTRTYQSQAKVAQLYGVAWKNYPEARINDANYTASLKEQRNIFLDLYAMMQADPNSLAVTLPAPYETVIEKSLEVLGTDRKAFVSIMESIADADNGFDWVVRTNRVGSAYERTLELGHPNVGAPPSDSMAVFEYIDNEYGSGGNVTNYWCNDSMGSAGTNVYGMGAGEGADMITTEVVHSDLLSGGFPRYDIAYSRKDVESRENLEALTRQRALVVAAPVSVMTLEVKADAEPTVGSYAVGDNASVQIWDPRFPDRFIKTRRILGIDYTPPQDTTTEEVRLTFEGEE